MRNDPIGKSVYGINRVVESSLALKVKSACVDTHRFTAARTETSMDVAARSCFEMLPIDHCSTRAGAICLK